ncbi:hypothetical protein W02_19680 [Nitrospira sp. KM1]|uniref:PAS domain-containing sensor histidine kinase n=1 Tax=Nitrospira sp. KM1 TaxID=1936990 RepID=UPI0013A7AB01|nr:PAS domain S-box protein [Nitrospira sp. KM1]BCA54828.1 hypothetical protein W02_19680 [Nitrospira sp. KM1]
MGIPTTLPEALSEIERLQEQLERLRAKGSRQDLWSHGSRASVESAEALGALREFAGGIDTLKRQEFFPSLVRRLSSAMRMKHAVVSESITGFRFKTLAVWSDRTFGKAYEGTTVGTPYDDAVIQRGFCSYSSGVSQRFPDHTWLPASDIQSCFVVPLFGSTGLVIGMLSLMDDAPRNMSRDQQALFQLVGACAGVELARQQAEHAMERREAHYRAVLECSTDLVAVTDLTGCVQHLSPSIERAMGCSREILVGREVFNLFHPDDRAGARAALSNLCVSREDDDMRCGAFRLQHHSGAWRMLDVAARIVPSANGSQDSIILMLQEVAAHRRVDEEQSHVLVDLENIMETVPDLMFTLDYQGFLIKWNSRVQQVTGYTAEELRHKPALAFVPLEEYDRTTAAIQQALTEGTAELEGRLLTKDGRLIPYHWTGAALKDSWGHTVGIAGIGRDVTEQKRIESALRANEERYARATAVGKVGVWELDVDKGLYYGDTNLKALFGYGPLDLSTDPAEWLNLVHPDDRTVALSSWAEVSGSLKESFNYELRMIRKDGVTIWTEVRGHAVRDVEGRLTHLIGATVDTTERKQAQDALERSEQQLRTVLDTLPIGVWFTDSRGHVLYGNPAGQQLWSRAKTVGLPDHVSGKLWWEGIDEAESPHRWAIGTIISRDRTVLNETIMIETESGERKTLRNSAVPVRQDDGTVLGALILNEDITDRIQAEEDVHRTRMFLESIVENIPHMIVVKDAKTLELTLVNRAAKMYLGIEQEQLLGKSLYDCFPEHQADMLLEQDHHTLESNSVHDIREHVLDTKHFGARVFSSKSVPIRNGFEPSHLLLISEDITERKRAEEALRESEERFAKAFRSSPHAVVISELQSGKIIDANGAAFQLFSAPGRGIGETINTDRDLWPTASHRDRFVANLCEAGVVRNMEVIVHTRRKEMRHCLMSAELIELHGRRCMVTVCSDITELKRAEEALRQRERDLRSALDERERISQDLHDGILQSLYAVGLGIETCRPYLRRPHMKRVTRALDLAVAQLNAVMRDIRGFISGLETELQHGRDFPAAVRTMVHELAQPHDTRCRVAIDPAATEALTAEQGLHLFSIVKEAMSNSLRHAKAKDASVSLRAVRQGLRLSIRDNGVGFVPSEVVGTGRGLGNMAARANKVGGVFTVRSRPKHGTRIVLDLPREVIHA